jgi:hypothetical protein
VTPTRGNAYREITVRSVGRLADIVANLAQRPVGLGHHRRGDLEHVHLARPHPQLDGYSHRGQPSVVQQDLGTGYMDQRAGQTGFDMVERFVDLLADRPPTPESC